MIFFVSTPSISIPLITHSGVLKLLHYSHSFPSVKQPGPAVYIIILYPDLFFTKPKARSGFKSKKNQFFGLAMLRSK